MGISFDPRHFKLYGSLARLLVKHGRGDLLRPSGLEAALQQPEDGADEAEATPEATALAADLERLGPTFVKLGQLLSTRPDLISAPYIDALSRLQDRLEPFPFEEVEHIVEEELGVSIDRAFRSFTREPVAAASLGQVHRATLPSGRAVVVKVQRPGIRKRIVEDLEALGGLAESAERHAETARRYGLERLLTQFRTTILAELDYRREARNLETLRANLADFEHILVPEPVEEYTTSRVLTMAYIEGRKVTELSPLARIEIDGEALADELFRAYLKQILVDGFYHADPHPGNVFLADGCHLALIDVGMVGRIAPALQDQLLRMMLAMGDGSGDEVARVAIEIGEPMEGLFDRAGFTRDVTEMVTRFYGATAEEMEMGRMVIELTSSAATNGLLMPGEVSTLGRAFLALDEVGRTLDPHFDPNAAIRTHSGAIMQRRMRERASPARLFATLLETNDFMQRLPSRAGRVLEALAENELEVGIRVTEAQWLMAGLQKVSNRIATGLVLAALIIGAALLMRVETAFRIWGYPGLAIVLFLAAAALGLLLVLNIVLRDVRDEMKSRRR